MFSQNEIFYVKPATYGFSNIIRDRVAETSVGSQLKNLQFVSSADDRQKLIKLLMDQPAEFLGQLNLSKAETDGRHDVVHGGQPLGDFYFTDMLSGLHDITPEQNILDFGCSTGRVIRNLRAAFEFNAYGCDPREESIKFNKEHFRGIEWFQSNEAPPIQNKHSLKFDMVFAISVWSHFSPEMSLKWFEEFHKVMNKKGRIIFSTHGTRSVYHFRHKLGKMSDEKVLERLNVLRDGGYHYMPYPSGGDLDAKHWGMAFISRAWLEENIGNQWKIVNHMPGMAMENQDVYVLEKRG